MVDTMDTRRRVTIADIVDFDRYALDDTNSRTKLINEAQKSLEKTSCVVLPGFLKKGVAARMAKEAEGVLPLAYRRDKQYPAYSADSEVGEVGRRLFWNKQFVTPSDILPTDGLINTLYAWDGMTSFVADVMCEKFLYRLGDELMRCVTTIMGNGDQHGWHFDANDFVVSLLLQKPESGGEFEFAPNIRSALEENEADVASVFNETGNLTRIHAVDAGTLMLFCGRWSLHRVRAIAGSRRRIIALFSYDRTPNVVHTPEVRMRAVGRAQPLA